MKQLTFEPRPMSFEHRNINLLLVLEAPEDSNSPFNSMLNYSIIFRRSKY